MIEVIALLILIHMSELRFNAERVTSDIFNGIFNEIRLISFNVHGSSFLGVYSEWGNGLAPTMRQATTSNKDSPIR